jgi:hypothetical protein
MMKVKASYMASWDVVHYPLMGAMKKVGPRWIQRLTTNVLNQPESSRMGEAQHGAQPKKENI